MSERGDFRIVLFTGRPTVGTFFATLGGGRSSAVVTSTFDVSTSEVERASRAVMAASVAVVDASIDPVEARAVCRQLRTLHTELRIGLLFCCSHAATSDSLRPFLDAGIGSFLDLQLSSEQTLAALRGIARGEDVFRLHLSEDRAEPCSTATVRMSGCQTTI
jgi:hypothetical protein